jgi:hypothetical protein
MGFGVVGGEGRAFSKSGEPPSVEDVMIVGSSILSSVGLYVGRVLSNETL